MSHFSEQVWADFARDAVSTRANQEIAAHLATGCSDCAAAAGIWKRVSSIAANEPSLTPPDGAVRMIKLEFSGPHKEKPCAWSLAKLMFDSLAQPLTAGVRSGASDSRQLMFEAEGTMVDLVLDTQSQSGTISLVGQVVDKDGVKVAPRQVTVILWTETGQPLAETSANEFGEFQLQIAAVQRLRLSVEIAGEKAVRIPPIELEPDVTGHPVT